MNIVYDLATGEVNEIDDNNHDPNANRDLAWSNLRAQRNARLAACDWTVLSDTPTSTTAWKAYRQQLRDLPDNTTDPFEPVWPTPPA